MVLRPDGTGVESDPSGERQSDYVRCPHCGRMNFVGGSVQEAMIHVSLLGFCAKCNHPVCPECAECVPNERQLDNMEAGRHILTPTSPFAAFPHNPLILTKGWSDEAEAKYISGASGE